MSFLISRHTDVRHIRRDQRFYAKGFEPFVAQDLESVSLTITRFAWSPCRFTDGKRRASHFADANLVALDFDNGLLPLAQACRVFADCQHVIGTTYNHQKDKGGIVCDRFRVVFVLEETVTNAADYAATARYYAERHDADLKAVDAARFFWPCTDVVSVNDDAEAYRIEVIPAKGTVRAAPERYRSHGIVRRRTQIALRTFVPPGERNNFCFSVAKDLYDAGFSFDDIYAMIVASPTYRGSVAYDVGRDISDCVRSGIKSVDQGKAYGRRDGARQGAEEERSRESGGVEEGRREGAPIGALLQRGPEDEP